MHCLQWLRSMIHCLHRFSGIGLTLVRPVMSDLHGGKVITNLTVAAAGTLFLAPTLAGCRLIIIKSPKDLIENALGLVSIKAPPILFLTVQILVLACRELLLPTNEVAGRYCFHRRISVHGGVGWGGGTSHGISNMLGVSPSPPPPPPLLTSCGGHRNTCGW